MKPIVVVELLGGLGNQLFQYSIGRSLEINHGFDFYFSKDRFNDYKTWPFQLDLLQVNGKELTHQTRGRFKSHLSEKDTGFFHRAYERFSQFIGIETPKIFVEKSNFIFDPGFEKLNHDVLLRGYWQSPRYFESIEHILRQEFRLKTQPKGKNLELISFAQNNQVLSIHIRRGDYVTNPSAASFHGNCSLEYYKTAIELVREKTGIENYYIFSDDIDWCKHHLDIDSNVIFVDHNDKFSGYEDMRIMSFCSAHIIANSTFSWWGAWLAGKKSKITVAPRVWYADQGDKQLDIYPSHWTQI